MKYSSKISYLNVIQTIKNNPITFLILWGLWVSAEYWIFGEHSYMRIHDNVESNIPARIVAAMQVKNFGQLFFFRPEIMGGVDGLSAGLTGWWTADLLPFILLPPWMGYAALMVMQRVGAAISSYYLMKETGYDKIPSIVAGIVWSMYTWSQYDWMVSDRLGIPLLPLTLLIATKINDEENIKKIVFLTIFGGLLVSWYSTFVFSGPFLYFWTLIWLLLTNRLKLKTFIKIIPFVSFSFLWALPEILAMITHLPDSFRAFVLPHTLRATENNIFVTSSLLALGSLKSWILNRFGLVILFSSIALLAEKKAKERQRLAFLLATSIALAFFPNFLGHLTSLAGEDFLGIFKGFNFSRLGSISLFLPSLIIAQTFSTLMKNEKLSKLTLCSFVLLTIGFSVKIKLMQLRKLPFDSYHAHFNNDLIDKYSKILEKDHYRVASLQVGHASYKYSSNDQIFPATFQAYGLKTFDGYLSLYPNAWKEYWQFTINGLRNSNSFYKDYTEQRPYWLYLFGRDIKEPIENLYNIKLLSLASVKYLFSSQELDSHTLYKVDQVSKEIIKKHSNYVYDKFFRVKHILMKDDYQKPMFVYENPYAVPFVYSPEKVIPYIDQDDFLKKIEATEIDHLQQIMFSQSVDTMKQHNFSKCNIINFNWIDPDNISFTSDCPSEGIISIQLPYTPEWHFSLDNQEVSSKRGNHVFTSLRVPKGISKVRAKYVPQYIDYNNIVHNTVGRLK